MIKGYWMPILHSHLPFVKHPEYDYFLEEHWLYEAMTETYIPLLMKMKKLELEETDFRLTISVTPPLAEMLTDKYLMSQYMKYLNKLIELSQKEINRLKNDGQLQSLALFYNKRFEEIKSFFTDFLDYNVLEGYKYFSDLGKLEIITCGATHGFLPLLRVNPKAVEVQIAVAVETHLKHFDRTPDGIWLPECAYYEDLDEILKEYGIKYFFTETHGLTKGKPTPQYMVYAPVHTLNGLAVFARDPESSNQVWSSKSGYPGNVVYRDFYRDIGYDLDLDYIKPYIDPGGNRVFTGLKYYKITGETEHKELYDPVAAFNKTKYHGKDFFNLRTQQIEELVGFMDRAPLIVSPYDAELFGHWWFEGPDFIYNVYNEFNKQDLIKPVTPGEYLSMYPQNQTICPTPSSWGEKGYYNVWLNTSNDWIYRHLHFMADKVQDLADKYFHIVDDGSKSYGLKERALNQLVRELLLAQSSDWAFLISRETAIEYSTKRTKEHISNFNALLKSILAESIDEKFLEMLEHKNSIFKDIDFRIYSEKYKYRIIKGK
jgi:1,4-alpha-glucan branching enzyme